MSSPPDLGRKNISRWAIEYLIHPITLGAPICLLLMYLFPLTKILQNNLCHDTVAKFSLLFLSGSIECAGISDIFWTVTLILSPIQIFLLRKSFAKRDVTSSLMEIVNENINSGRWKSFSKKYFVSQAVLGMLLVVAIPILPSESLSQDNFVVGVVIIFLTKNWLFIHFFFVFIALMLGYTFISGRKQ